MHDSRRKPQALLKQLADCPYRNLWVIESPYHRTYGSRIRRFGSLSIITMPRRSPPALQLHSRARSGMWHQRPEDTALYYRSGLPSTHAEVLCLLLTPRARSDRIAPLLVVFRGPPLPRTRIMSPAVSRTPFGA